MNSRSDVSPLRSARKLKNPKEVLIERIQQKSVEASKVKNIVETKLLIKDYSKPYHFSRRSELPKINPNHIRNVPREMYYELNIDPINIDLTLKTLETKILDRIIEYAKNADFYISEEMTLREIKLKSDILLAINKSQVKSIKIFLSEVELVMEQIINFKNRNSQKISSIERSESPRKNIIENLINSNKYPIAPLVTPEKIKPRILRHTRCVSAKVITRRVC